MRTRSFGLDIGATTTKIVAVTKEGNSYMLQAAGMIATPPRGMLSE